MEIVILSDGELWILWAIALLLPSLAHWVVRQLSHTIGLTPAKTLPRVLFLTAASVLVLVWITGSRFASVRIDADEVQVRYAFPSGRTLLIPREKVADVWLSEARFPRTSFAIRIRSQEGNIFRSVGVTRNGLQPLYRIYESFRPGETPYVALQ